MRQRISNARLLSSIVVLAAIVVLLPGAAVAEQRNYTVGLSGGIGGTSDANPDPGFDNFALQALFRADIGISTALAVRVGNFGLEADGGGLFDADLTYLTVTGEYFSAESFYESSLFIGLGAYDLSGDVFVADETSVGLTVGAAGDFRINDRFSFMAELAGHLVDLDYTNFFITVNAGIAYHF